MQCISLGYSSLTRPNTSQIFCERLSGRAVLLSQRNKASKIGQKDFSHILMRAALKGEGERESRFYLHDIFSLWFHFTASFLWVVEKEVRALSSPNKLTGWVKVMKDATVHGHHSLKVILSHLVNPSFSPLPQNSPSWHGWPSTKRQTEKESFFFVNCVLELIKISKSVHRIPRHSHIQFVSFSLTFHHTKNACF